ncbi:MAG TPA: efflux RND transporter periplasmic adaptor subunit, partial [Nitrospira sp.]|nr:efflux RND transporter periplasmic adaptor subunit [Nitrospira sp.]
MTWWRSLGIGVVLLTAGAVVMWVMSRPAVLTPADSRQDDMAGMDMPGMGKAQQQKSAPVEKAVGPETPLESEGVPGIVTIPPERLQTIGVKYEQVARRPLEKVIRTVGRVVVDERRLAKVTIKFHGWIEQLFVSATGDHVKKGQRLFTIYSPDLVATQ